MTARVPAEVFAPGEFLADELEARGWSQVELAEILGRPPRLVSEIIAGKRAITPETAMGLSAAFGMSPQYWMNLETSYQLSKADAVEQTVTRRAKLYATFPVKEMIRRGWVEADDNIEVLERRFLDFFQIPSMDATPRFAHAARATNYESEPDIARLAWLHRAERVAKAVQVAKYSDAALRRVIPELRGCMQAVEEIRHVPALLAKAGVRFVVVEHLPKSKMDGACFWIGESPVIALSMRFDRVDNFWFNLFHEIDHVLNGDGKDVAIYELIEPDAPELPACEQRANAAASNYLIERREIEGFIARVSPLFSKAAIVGFAMRVKVHPGIVVGQLHGKKAVMFSHHREMLQKVREIVVSSALADGFGNKLPL